MLRTLIASVIVLAASASVASAQVRASINQGFEQPTRADVPPGQFSATFGNAFIVPQSLVPGWSSTHSPTCFGEPCIEVWDDGAANSGTQFIELNAFEESAAFLADVCLVNGETLDWSFYHRNRVAGDGPDVVEMRANDGVNSQLFTTQSTTSTSLWSLNSNSATVTVPTGIYNIEFVAAAPTGSLGNFLDDISITLTPLLEFQLADYTETEGDAVTVPQIVISGLVPAGGFTIPVSVVPSGTTASASDFTLQSTVFIPQGVYDGGATSRFDIGITLNEDDDIEGDETVEIAIGTGPGYDIAPIECTGGANNTAVYTIRDDDARLTLEKQIVNDDGGTETDNTQWTLEFDGGTSGAASGVQGAAAVTVANISEGTFALSETGGPSGYALSQLSCTGTADTSTSVANPNVTIAPGELVTCSFTNDDIAPVLTLVKTVSGGTASAGDFILSFSGPGGSGSGVSGAAAVTNVALQAGTYSLGESQIEFYSGVLACVGAADGDPNDGLTLGIGEIVTCTFTNTFNPIFDFSVSKTLDAGPTTNLGQNNLISDAGDQITYEITISNTGNSILDSFILTESLPGATIVCNLSGDNTIVSLGLAGTETCFVTYTILQSDFDTNGGGDGDIDNTITADANGGGTPITRDATETVPILQVSNIDLEKVADLTVNVAAGQPVTYTYTVTNTGNTTISGIRLNDVVTAGSGAVPTPGNEALVTPGGTAVSSTTNDGGVNGIWDALGPGDVIEFTGIYVVTQQDVDLLQ